MSTLHLATGDAKPPKTDNKFRLYGMEYCPYVQRVKLVLKTKGIDYETVNCNLINKPEWLFELHPEGKVPILDIGDKLLTESTDICNYLDENYPNPPLYPAEPDLKEKEIELINKSGDLIKIFYQIVMELEKKTPEEWLKELTPHLNHFEEVLKQRNSTYFGGETPNMMDYMIWPWCERMGTIATVLGESLPVGENDFKLIRAWRKSMRKHPIVDSLYHGPEKFHKILLMKNGKLPPDYDNFVV